jgi:hypothetical protein
MTPNATRLRKTNHVSSLQEGPFAFRVCVGWSTISGSSSCSNDPRKNRSVYVAPLPSVLSLISIFQIHNLFSPSLSTDGRAMKPPPLLPSPSPSNKHRAASAAFLYRSSPAAATFLHRSSPATPFRAESSPDVVIPLAARAENSILISQTKNREELITTNDLLPKNHSKWGCPAPDSRYGGRLGRKNSTLRCAGAVLLAVNRKEEPPL